MLIFHSSPAWSKDKMDSVNFANEEKEKHNPIPPLLSPKHNLLSFISSTASPSKCRRPVLMQAPNVDQGPQTLQRTARTLWHNHTPPAFHGDLRMTSQADFWMTRDLEQNISYGSAGRSTSTVRLNTQQDMLCQRVYMWEIKDKPIRKNCFRQHLYPTSRKSAAQQWALVYL